MVSQQLLTLCLLGSLHLQFTMAGRAVSEDLNDRTLQADVHKQTDSLTLVVAQADVKIEEAMDEEWEQDGAGPTTYAKVVHKRSLDNAGGGGGGASAGGSGGGGAAEDSAVTAANDKVTAADQAVADAKAADTVDAAAVTAAEEAAATARTEQTAAVDAAAVTKAKADAITAAEKKVADAKALDPADAQKVTDAEAELATANAMPDR